MLKVDTDRLYILPLNQKNLEISINYYDKMEKNLNLAVTHKKPSKRQKTVWNIRLNGVKNDPLNYVWHTVWVIVLKATNCIIGNILLKGYPNEEGEVIVGYSIDEK